MTAGTLNGAASIGAGGAKETSVTGGCAVCGNTGAGFSLETRRPRGTARACAASARLPQVEGTYTWVPSASPTSQPRSLPRSATLFTAYTLAMVYPRHRIKMLGKADIDGLAV